MVASPRRTSELLTLQRQAEALASKRKERFSTAHLLVAMTLENGSVAQLLRERRLDQDHLLLATRATTDDHNDALRRAADRAKEVAGRMRAPEPSAVHLLVALLSDRGFAAHRVLEQSGVDISRLRVAAMNVGLGQVGRQPIVTRRERSDGSTALGSATLTAGTASAGAAVRGVAVPMMSRVRVQTLEPAAITEIEDVAPVSGVKHETPAASLRNKRRVRNGAPRFTLSPKKFPTLCSLGRNLTLAAEKGELDPVHGRDAEIEQTLDVLCKRQANNPCLVGAAGVGKSSVARGVALYVATAEGLSELDERIIVEIPVSELLAGTGVRGALAQRLGALRKEVAAAEGRVVLFFDEIHGLFTGDGADEMVGELKLAFSRGELPCIGATTDEEYRKVIEADPALARRFCKVEIDEPSREDAYLVLEALAPELGKHHGVQFSSEALALSIAWSMKYLPGRALPDKAVGPLDLAGARARRRGVREVGPNELAEVIAEQAQVPLERLLETDGERMLRLEQLLLERVVGHDEKLAKIARIIRRNAAGLNGRRPIGTFLLLGPTGVGKTETAKALAAELFSSDTAMTRIDLSEYSEPHAVARLIGAPPGYVGHEAGGQLTEAVRQRPYQVVLLDEVEKAHTDVLQSFLGVFDEGRLTDGRGRTVDFTNTVIVMTSNLGSGEAQSKAERRVGFGSVGPSRDRGLEQRIVAAARGALAPELYNRIDETLVFMPLTRDNVTQIARRLLQGLGESLRAQHQVQLVIETGVIDVLLDRGGFEPELGARPLKRAIARLIEAPLAEKLLAGEVSLGGTIRLCAAQGEISIRAQPLVTAAE
ncbi:MAG TPA: ATP-dependent Clp protease ATP-binding subunit [Polyangiaceae bacterium]|nr:ATP-dependent Clp protease ATP-binding subunit [Polyangiaceae bacterium]